MRANRKIDRSKPLGEASEHDLLIALGDLWAKQEARHLTRSAQTEVRHSCHYMACRLNDLRNAVVRPEYQPVHVLLELAEIIAALQQLSRYVMTGKGGTSALHDRNEG